MLKALSPGVVGVKTSSLEERVAAARDYGFAAVELDINEIARRIDESGVESVLAVLGEIKPAGFGLPTDWRGDEDKWRASLEDLKNQAKAAAAIGATRTFTWIISGSNDRTLEENRRFHVERFTPIAEILGEHGCSVGLEFLGPKTIRDNFTHPFIYKMHDMLDMAREIGPNAGLLVDCWHWYTGGGTIDELKQLEARDVVYVHVNDAPEGVELDQQIDHIRRMPGQTGVIPIAEFLQALQSIGYDGPVVAEPFSKELNDLPSDADRLKMTAESMDKIFRQAGLE